MGDGENKPRNPRITKDTLSLAVCSALRRGILICLKEGKKPLRDLRAELGVSSTTAIHALRELEKNNLVFQDEDRDYALTKIGEIIALKLVDFVEAIDVLKKHERFWLEHDLSGIPPHLLEKIGWLQDSTLIEAPVTDIFKVDSIYIELLKIVREVRGISSIFDPSHPKIFGKLLRRGVDIQLILTKEILEKTIETSNAEIIQSKNLVIYTLKSPLKIGITVTDKFLSLGLYHVDGPYDYSRDLLGYDKRAIDWGNELFEYYRKRAEKCRV